MSKRHFQFYLRFFLIPALVVAAGTASLQADVGKELINNSPFLPEGYTPPRPVDRRRPPPPKPPEEKPLDSLEFRSLATLSGGLTFSLYDPMEKRGFWLGVDESEAGFTILEFKEKEDAVVVRHDGETRTISLHESKVLAMANPPPETRSAPQASNSEPANPEERMQNLAEEIRRRREVRRALIEKNQRENPPLTQ